MEFNMLSIAISSFFALALIVAVFVIVMMLQQYRDRIIGIVQTELFSDRSEADPRPATYRHRARTLQLTNRARSSHPVPLRAAA